MADGVGDCFGMLNAGARVDITRLFRMHYVTVFAKTARVD